MTIARTPRGGRRSWSQPLRCTSSLGLHRDITADRFLEGGISPLSFRSPLPLANGILASFILYSSLAARSLSTKDERHRVTVKRAAKGEIESGKRNRNPDPAETAKACRIQTVEMLKTAIRFTNTISEKKKNTKRNGISSSFREIFIDIV